MSGLKLHERLTLTAPVECDACPKEASVLYVVSVNNGKQSRVCWSCFQECKSRWGGHFEEPERADEAA